MSIYSIQIQNFKSIRDSGDVLIKPLNILIGPNGVGKSNFIGFFKFLNMLFEQQLQNHIARKGRVDGLMYFGRRSKYIAGNIIFTNEDNNVSNRYSFKMEPDQSNSLFFTEEYSDYNISSNSPPRVLWDLRRINLGGSLESKLPLNTLTRSEFLKSFFKSFKIFHFHDTSDTSKLKGFCNSSDYEYLVENGSNLPAFLYRMQKTHPKNFKMLEYAIKSIAPFIDNLYLEPDQINPNQIELRFREIGHENLFNAYSLSDGTLRFICLCTLLLQPQPPKTIIIDEPELGLHPSAIIKLGSMLKSASVKAQIIVSTQSVNLLDQFAAEDIIIVERNDGQTVFKRQNDEELERWLSEYSLGELWSKNVLGGTP